MTSPTAALIIIGDEILSGRTQDVHVSTLAQKLKEIGISLSEVHIIPDTFDAIIRSIHNLQPRSSSLFTTGGIGPTHDDITIDAISQALNLEMIIHPEAFSLLKSYYASQDIPFTNARQLMARAPKGASLIPNPVSGAPGFHIHNIYILAGVPSIAHAMLDNVIPTLKGGDIILATTILTNLPESAMQEAVILATKTLSVKIGSYPSYHRKQHGVALVIKSHSQDHIHQTLHILSEHAQKQGGNIHILKGEH